MMQTVDRNDNQQLEMFFRAAFSIDLTIFAVREDRLQVALVKRIDPPYVEQVSLPGKLVYPNEDTGQAAQLLAQELLNLPEVFCRQTKAFTSQDRHPVGRVITIAYLVLVSEKQVKEGASKGLLWTDVNEVPTLPFDHNLIVEESCRTFRKEARHDPLVFEMLPEKFAIPDLRKAYEAIFEEEIDTRNFARKVGNSDLIEPLDSFRASRGRKARLYHFRKDLYASREGGPLHLQF